LSETATKKDDFLVEDDFSITAFNQVMQEQKFFFAFGQSRKAGQEIKFQNRKGCPPKAD
jgi:hypothetical protein